VWMLDSTAGPERPPADRLLDMLQERLSAFGFVVPESAMVSMLVTLRRG
jgi:hypothetical protein